MVQLELDQLLASAVQARELGPGAADLYRVEAAQVLESADPDQRDHKVSLEVSGEDSPAFQCLLY